MTDKETGITFDFPGTEEDLAEAQERFHNQVAQREKMNRLCTDNALRNIHKILRAKYGNRPVKAYAEWLATQNREVISGKDYSFIMKLDQSVMCHPVAAELLAAGQAEGVVRAEYCGVPCQIRMDWFSPVAGLVDLKTCDSLKWFESDCRRFGYIFQMAFYRAVIREVTGINVPVHMIAVEKNEPFSTGVWKLTDEVLNMAEPINQSALRNFRECLNSGIWPTGYEEKRIIDTL